MNASISLTEKERIAIDRSTRGPVLLFFCAAVAWLMISTLFALIASLKMHHPTFLDGPAWLTFGRIQPSYLDSFLYGWGVNVGMGVCTWLMVRLSRTRLVHPRILMLSALFWNLGVFLGVIGILGGGGTGVEWLDFPPLVTPLLFISFILMAVWGVVTFRLRKPGFVYVSQWYLLAALFWFPWLYATAHILLFISPVQGVLQSIVNDWFISTMAGLWFASIGLASVYYFIPKVIGKPVHSYHLAALGFWTFALLSCWCGGRMLTGGPVPVWIPSSGIVASVMMMIPVAVVAMNHHMTMQGSFPLLLQSPTLRFTVFGAMCYTLANVLGLFTAFRSVDQITHFTYMNMAQFNLGMYAFYTMAMFGAMYYIVPRLVGCEWRSATMIKLHFWGSFYGILLMVLMLSTGGIVQGFAISDPTLPFIEVVNRTEPFLVGRSIAMILITVAHFTFAYHFCLMLMRLGLPAGEATLFPPEEEEELHEEVATV